MDTESNATKVKKYPEPDRSIPIQTRDTYLLIATFASVMIAMGILMAFMHRNCRKSLFKVKKWLLHLRHSNPTCPRNESSRIIMSLGLNDPTSPIFSKEINPPTSVFDIRGSNSNLDGYSSRGKSNPISEEDSGISVISDVPTIVHYSLIRNYSEKMKSKSFDKSLELSVTSDLNYNQLCFPEERHGGPTPGLTRFPGDGRVDPEDKDDQWITPVKVQLLHRRDSRLRKKSGRIKSREFIDRDSMGTENYNGTKVIRGDSRKYRDTNDNVPQSDSCLQDTRLSRKWRRRRDLDRKKRRSESLEDTDFTLINTADWINSNDIYKRNTCYWNSSYVTDSSTSLSDVFNENAYPPNVRESGVCSTTDHFIGKSDHPIHKNKTVKRYNIHRRDKESIMYPLEREDNLTLRYTNANDCVLSNPSLTFEEIAKRKSFGRKLPKVPIAKCDL